MWLVSAAPAHGGARLDVVGAVDSSQGTLDVRVDLTNHGDEKAAPLSVEGELFGRRDSVRLEKGIGPGETRSVLLRFPLDFPRPGRHALALLIEYTQAAAVAVSQRAYLLLALGADPAPAVRLSVGDAFLESMGALAVRLESADGGTHSVRLRVLTPKTLRADVPDRDVGVPARGTVSAPVRIFRGTAPWGTEQGVVVVAGASDGPEERTAVATAVVHVLPDPAWLPRLRLPLFALAVALLAGAVGAEVRRRGRLC